MQLAPTIQPAPVRATPASPEKDASPLAIQGPGSSGPAQDDGTAQLLKWGGWTLAVGILCAVLMKTALGGIGPQGPHTNGGWLALIVTMMCLPFGCLLFLLGALKWLRNRRLMRHL